MMYRYDYQFKVILLGEVGSGKSSIFERLIHKTYENPINPILIDFGLFNCQIDHLRVRLQVWDTAGRERFRAMYQAYYKNAAGVVLVFDVCRQQTLFEIDWWLEEISKFCDENVVKILVGNKKDMKSRRQVGEEEARTFAAERSMAYFESSAKQNINVENIFLLLADELKRVKDEMKVSSAMFGSPPIQPTNYQSTCW